MTIRILTITLLTLTAVSLCDPPQKSFFMSYEALGKADTLSKVFAELDTHVTVRNASYSDNFVSYQITNLRSQLFYNEHYQVEKYENDFEVKVALGIVEVGQTFNYTIIRNQQTKRGWIRARAHLDQGTFVKKITMSNGKLQWYTTSLDPLSFTQQILIEHAEPSLNLDEQQTMIRLMNDDIGTKPKQAYMSEFNTFYKSTLDKYLNSEDLLSTNNIIYNYEKITLNYTHSIRSFKLANSKSRGLQAYLIFGLDSSSEPCNTLPDFEQKYGGLQEYIAFTTIAASLKEAILKGLLDITLARDYQVSQFQFFMGDLGNSVPYANKLPSEDRFDVVCSFPTERIKEIKVTAYKVHDVYFNIPQRCKLVYKQKDILAVNFSMSLIARMTALENTLRVVILETGISGDKYESIDPNYVVTKPYVAQFAVASVMQGLVGKTVFGNGFPSLQRKYPSVEVTDDYLVFFDASQK